MGVTKIYAPLKTSTPILTLDQVGEDTHQANGPGEGPLSKFVKCTVKLLLDCYDKFSRSRPANCKFHLEVSFVANRFFGVQNFLFAPRFSSSVKSITSK